MTHSSVKASQVTASEFDLILRKTLEDHRVSRGERRVLRQILDELDPDDHQMAFLRHRAFAVAHDELTSPEARAVLSWLEEIVKLMVSNTSESQLAETRSEAWFSPDDDCVEAIVSRLEKVRKTAEICVFTITDNRISSAMLDCHHRGVDIRVITDNDKSEDRGSDITRLDDSGIPVRLDQTAYHMHHKFAIFDRRLLLTGSYNWTRSAAEVNEENILATAERRLVELFSRQFERLWLKLA